MEEERKGLGADSAGAASAPAAPAPPPATGAAVAATPAGEGGGNAGGSGGEALGDGGSEGSGGGGTTVNGAPRKRRRGRRGGRRHKKKPDGTNGNGNGNEDEDGGAGDGHASDDTSSTGNGETRTPSAGGGRSQQNRRPSQQRGGRPAAGSRPKPGESPDAPAAAGETPGDTRDDSSEDGGTATTGTGQPRKRRRRGGRGRGGSGRSGGSSGAGTREAASASGDGEAGDGGDGDGAGSDGAATDGKTGEAPASGGASRQRSSRSGGGAGRAGGTRLAAQKARREQRPRRPRKRLSEGEARALRGEAKTMLIHDHEDRTQIAVLESGALIEHFVAHQKSRTIVGNVYLGKVQNVLPSMEAAFVDVGRGRNAVLYAGEVNYEAEDLEGDGPMPRIEQILKPGQAVMVQVTKDALGTKGARLTAQISLAGRYLVLAPEQNVSGISRRLAEDERSRLRQIFRDIKPKQHGVIVRTAAEGASREALERDLSNLLKVWEDVQAEKKKAKAPALLHAEPELVMRVVRDIFSGDFERVVVDSRAMFETIRGYLEEQGPDLIERIELHEGPLPMLEQHHVTEQIHKALERKVWLPSGGSIVIDRTEAMTVIDVNTGKFVGKGGSLEDTVLKNNIEAAEEVARQLRLRDIGGIIVIDFIDMLLPSNREQVLRTLKRALGRDKTRSQVFDVSNLGLVEMTRKRVSEGLLDAFSEPCPNCDGRGIVITHDID